MRKIIILTVAVASILATAAVANAQWQGICYLPYYWHWVFNGFTWVWVCSL
jgi:hypothetical protein